MPQAAARKRTKRRVAFMAAVSAKGRGPASERGVTAELGSLSSVKHLAAKGLGIAIASRAAISAEVEAGKLVCVPLDPPLFTPLEVILLKDKFRSRLVSTFADFVAEEIARLSSERY